MVHKQIKFIPLCLALFATGAVAQTTVTGTGTANTIPLFTGSSILGNSNITQLSGKVGIGTTSPAYPLDVNGAIRVLGSAGFLFSSNNSVYLKESYGPQFGLGDGSSSYGANFLNSSGTSVMYVRSDGNVGIGTTAPASTLDVATNASQSPSGGLSVRGSDSHFVRVYPSLGSGNYNNIVQAGDQAIIYSNGSAGGAFVIAPWANTTT